MFRSYIDESGIHDGSKFCMIGGYVGRAEEWAIFEKDWQGVLDKYRVCWFHAKEFFSRAHPTYHRALGWTDTRKDEFLNELIDAINARDVFLMASAVDVHLFFKLTMDERRQFTGGHYNHERKKWGEQGKPNAPYFLPFHHCLQIAAYKVPEGELLYPVVAEHNDYKIKVAELYPLIRNNEGISYSSRLAPELLIASPRSNVMLQAADLAAYSFYKFAQLNKPKAKGERYFRRLTEKLTEPLSTGLFDKRGLNLLLNDMSERPTISHLRTTFLR
jgi:hypothetical protein